MYRRRSRKRLFVVPAVAQSGHDLGAESVGGRVWSTWYVCMNAGARTWARMGDCMRCCWAGLLCCHGTTLCRGGGALGTRGATVCAEALNHAGRTVYGCVYLCTQSALGRTGFRRHRRRDRRACCRCGRPGLLRAQEGQSKIFEDGKCAGSGGVCGKQRVSSASTLHLLLGHCNCLLLGCLWAQHLWYL